ncbi:hypothetical protein L6494_27110 [Nostoc sp. UHCC 0870]|uniref:hypothetical protein n=1 Tax=Nostoc sp. UHCC 0870 TaxID=2914041 RepID=UPI001EDD47C3|nr:hypothetical protein [Nostoc sp. UHCC 0870]UKO98168.1 hypothetical protein L6494_27110 [Nostoc sp. UHCC 0870]
MKPALEPVTHGGLRYIIHRFKMYCTLQKLQCIDIKKIGYFIQAIVFYKFPTLSVEEIEAMLDFDEFKNTRLYKSILAKTRPETELETKLKLVPKCIQRGMSIQEIAEFLELDVETIRKSLQEQSE